MSLTARLGLISHLLDAANAFIESDLDKPNCMEILEGLQDFDPDAKGDVILKLMKSLYRLCQSVNLWHRKITGFLKKIGFQPTTVDSSIFMNG